MSDLLSDGWTERGKEWLAAGCPPIKPQPPIWSPMGSAPKDRTTIEALVPLKSGGFVQGRVYFEAEAYDGTWWWVEGPAYDYHADAIDECNHGNPGFWLEGSEGDQMSSIAFIDQTMARIRKHDAALQEATTDVR